MEWKSERAVACGAGGFIGGHPIQGLQMQVVAALHAVDSKPVKDRHQIFAGVEKPVTVIQLIDLAEEIGGVQLARSYNLSAPSGVNRRNSGNTQILDRLGWEPSVRLRAGLKNTYRWIEGEIAAGIMAGARG